MGGPSCPTGLRDCSVRIGRTVACRRLFCAQSTCCAFKSARKPALQVKYFSQHVYGRWWMIQARCVVPCGALLTCARFSRGAFHTPSSRAGRHLASLALDVRGHLRDLQRLIACGRHVHAVRGETSRRSLFLFAHVCVQEDLWERSDCGTAPWRRSASV